MNASLSLFRPLSGSLPTLSTTLQTLQTLATTTSYPTHPTTTPSPDNHPSAPLSKSAKIGIGCSIAVLVLIGIVLALFDFLWLRKRRKGTWMETTWDGGQMDQQESEHGEACELVGRRGKEGVAAAGARNGMSLTKKGEEVRREVL